MAIGVIVLLVNVVVTSLKKERVGNDPWQDGRTMEWALSSPPVYYNFKQIPLVRGQDTWWIEKMEGKNELTPSEPLQDIHMPNNSIIPFFIALGLFIAAFGAMYNPLNSVGDGHPMGTVVLILGLALMFGSMLVRSIRDDLGYYIPKEDIENDAKGGKVS